MAYVMDSPLQVTVIDCVDEVDEQSFVESMIKHLHAKVLEHLKQTPEYFKSADLDIKITKCTARHFPNEIRWNIYTETTGTINNSSIEFTAFTTGKDMVFREGLSNNIVSVTASLASDIKNLMSSEYDYEQDFVHNASHRCVKNAIFNVTHQILESIDEQIDRQPSTFSKRWKRIQTSRWITAGLVALVTLCTTPWLNQARRNISETREELFEMGIINAVFFSVAAFFLIHCWGYLIMPPQFYQTETAGKKALKYAGTSSIIVLKMVALALVGVILFSLTFYADLLLNGE